MHLNKNNFWLAVDTEKLQTSLESWIMKSVAFQKLKLIKSYKRRKFIPGF